MYGSCSRSRVTQAIASPFVPPAAPLDYGTQPVVENPDLKLPKLRALQLLLNPAAYAHERAVCVDTTAAGGNASLLAAA